MRLEITNEQKADVIDRAILALLPAGLVWYSLSTIPYWLGATSIGGQVIADPSTILLARLLSIGVGVVVGVPIALLITHKADGWGLLEEPDREPVDRSGEASTSSDS